jgi:hypothetical protein
MLIIQPTSSGKSAYAKELAKLPNTLVVLACPFDKLVKQEMQSPGSLDIKHVNWGTLPMTVQVRFRCTFSFCNFNNNVGSTKASSHYHLTKDLQRTGLL